MKVIIPAVVEVDGKWTQVGDAELDDIPLRRFGYVDGSLVAVLDINLDDPED